MIWNPAPGDERTAIVTMHWQHNPSSIRDLAAAFDEIARTGTIRTVVFTSGHEKNWCTGLDTGWIMEQYSAGDQAPVKDFFREGTARVFRPLLTMPLVTIAAVNGHAWGNGVVFALHCDIRLMRGDRGYFCLPEVELGLTDAFSPSSLVLFEKRFGSYITDVMIPTGKRIAAAELLANGLVDEVADGREGVMDAALARAKSIGEDDALRSRILEERARWSPAVTRALDADDENKFDYMIGRFWQLMQKMKGA